MGDVRIKVKFIEQKTGAPITGLFEGVEGFFQLNTNESLLEFLLDNAEEAGPLFHVDPRDILEASPKTEGVIGKKEILKLVLMDENREPRNLRFQIHEITAGQAAAIMEAFKKKPEENEREKISTSKIWAKVTDSLVTEAQRFAEQIRIKMDASKQLISEVGRIFARLDELGPEDFENRVSNVLDLAVETEVVPAIINSLMAKGLVAASNDNLDEATETIRQAIAAARVENLMDEVEKAQKQLNRIEDMKKGRLVEEQESQQDIAFREETLAAALKYMEECQVIIRDWSTREDESSPLLNGEHGAAS